MTTDNRTNVQIVADALRSMPDAERDDDRDPAVVVAEYAVAALVAAQGAAPQAATAHSPVHFECDCVPNLGPPHCHTCSDEVGSPVMWSACHNAAPVLSSSGVDEEKLAEVRKRLEEADASVAWTHGDAWSPKARKAHNDLRAAVAEWLKGQGVGKY